MNSLTWFSVTITVGFLLTMSIYLTLMLIKSYEARIGREVAYSDKLLTRLLELTERPENSAE